ncbi:hypothetical protein Y032_0021g291 [Ancylostoma ceylanicum]|uniref:Uncharacterized protein n=1 Tax=Ancylostoma ceylanicum TaxID=53326 RepID=A0A016UZL0_9BILA|nr:hypothetical protein Y032_0021g291 [Ancylostoma ceylanicum]
MRAACRVEGCIAIAWTEGESYARPDLMYPSQQHMTELTALPSTTVAKATHLLATRTRCLNSPAVRLIKKEDIITYVEHDKQTGLGFMKH